VDRPITTVLLADTVAPKPMAVESLISVVGVAWGSTPGAGLARTSRWWRPRRRAG
jgi:hypothetical protein